MRITALAGGIGAARFLRGLLVHLAAESVDPRPAGRGSTGGPAGVPADITVIGNTGDDVTLHGLRICPDLDTVMYTLGGGVCESQGWGRAGETHEVAAELRRYGTGPGWFGLGDRDVATHLVRTSLLARGHGLADVTATLCERWRPGVRLLPMTEDRVETHVVVEREPLRAARRRADAADRAGPDDRGRHPSGRAVTAKPAGAEKNDQLRDREAPGSPERGTQDRDMGAPSPYGPGAERDFMRTGPWPDDDHNETIGNTAHHSAGRESREPAAGPAGVPGTGFDEEDEESARYEKIHFQEWWVRLRAGVPAREIVALGAARSRPAPGVLEAIAAADVVLLPPSNPVVSIGTILSVPGIREAVRDCRAPVVGVSPIVGGAPVRGMADACLAARGLPTTAGAVAGLYADFLDGWLVDERDAGTRPAPSPSRPRGPVVRALPLLMSDPQEAARIAGQALRLATELRADGPVDS